jgi:hypothetical protein
MSKPFSSDIFSPNNPGNAGSSSTSPYKSPPPLPPLAYRIAGISLQLSDSPSVAVSGKYPYGSCNNTSAQAFQG